MKTLYDVLGVPRDASEETIRAAFRRAAKSHHPDVNVGDPTAEQQFRQLVAAYEMLRNPHQRAAYDHYLKSFRRARARRFAAPSVAGLASGVVVAVGVWLSASLFSGPPQTMGVAGANVGQGTSRQLAAADDSEAQQDRDRRASDWAAAAPNRRLPDERPQQLQQSASILQPATLPAATLPAATLPAATLPPTTLPPVTLQQATVQPTTSQPGAQALLAKEWEQVLASGDPMAIWEFVAHNPEAPESALARSKLIVLIDSAEDVFLLHLLRVGATDTIAERARQRLVRLGAIAAPEEDRAASRDSTNSLGQRAVSFVSAQISGWSSTHAVNLASLTNVYAAEVLYYGSLKSRQAVVVDKRRLLKQWPERAYEVQPDSITVQCVANVCKIEGLMDWQTRSSSRAAPTSGTSKFAYGVITLSHGTFNILSEDSAIVPRPGEGNSSIARRSGPEDRR